MKFLRWLTRRKDKMTRGPLRELMNTGPWRVHYPDGQHSIWTDYPGALNLRACFGGEIVHKNQLPTRPQENDR